MHLFVSLSGVTFQDEVIREFRKWYQARNPTKTEDGDQAKARNSLAV